MTDQPAGTRQEMRSRLPLRLSNGRVVVVVVDLPMPMQAEELLELIATLPSAVAEANLELLGGIAGKVALPGGRAVTVLGKA